MADSGLTVTVTVLRQPVPSVYVITGVPAATPVTMPVEPIVASVASLVLHVPPEVTSVNDTGKPTHTVAVPVMAAGNGLTVTTEVDLQPVGNK